MILRCIRNNSQSLPEDAVKHLSKFMRSDKNQSYLTVGMDYVVFGITFWDGHPWFYVYEEESDTYPIPRPHHYFDILRGEVDSSWVYVSEPQYGSHRFKLLPKEWCSDSLFYEKLVDGEPEYLAKMKIIRSDFQARYLDV